MVVYPATIMVAPGVILHEHGSKLPIGEPGGGHSERVARLHEMLVAAGFDAPVRDDIRDEIWLKLWGNVCFNPLERADRGDHRRDRHRSRNRGQSAGR